MSVGSGLAGQPHLGWRSQMSDGWAEPAADGHGDSPGWMLKVSVQDGLGQPLASQTKSSTAERLLVSHWS